MRSLGRPSVPVQGRCSDRDRRPAQKLVERLFDPGGRSRRVDDEVVEDAGSRAQGVYQLLLVPPPAIVRRHFALHAEIHLDIPQVRSEEHTSELQSLMRISYAVFCLKKKTI